MSKEIEVGLKECSKCEYHLRCEKCVGSFYREEIPKLNKRIKELEEQLAITENAYKMACEELSKVEVFDKEFMDCESFYDYFKTKAKGE